MDALDLVMMKRFGGGSGGGGSGGGALVVNVTEVDEVKTCDKTAGEMFAACPMLIFQETTEYGTNIYPLVGYQHDEELGYMFAAAYITDPLTTFPFMAATANDYPAAGGGPK